MMLRKCNLLKLCRFILITALYMLTLIMFSYCIAHYTFIHLCCYSKSDSWIFKALTEICNSYTNKPNEINKNNKLMPNTMSAKITRLKKSKNMHVTQKKKLRAPNICMFFIMQILFFKLYICPFVTSSGCSLYLAYKSRIS